MSQLIKAPTKNLSKVVSEEGIWPVRPHLGCPTGRDRVC